MTRIFSAALLASILAIFIFGDPAFAQEAADTTPGFVDGIEEDRPDPIGTGLREAASPVANELHAFYEQTLLPMKLLISFFVLGLLIWAMVRYNAKANPIPKKFSHNTLVEVLWTAVPVLILVIIAIPSFDLLYLEDVMPDGQVYEYDEEPGQTDFAFTNDFAASRRVTKERHLDVFAIDAADEERILQPGVDYEVEGLGEETVLVRLADALPAGERLRVVAGRSRVGTKKLLGVFGEDTARVIQAPTITIKATGYQWGWAYSYPDFGDFEFDALMAPPEATTEELYRLATTNDIVVPEGETIRVITTARDVIHSWAMPAFGIKIDAIPGRLNETWFQTDKEKTFYGQCSEICGKDHAFMPISVRVVSREEFEAWVDERRELEGMEPFFAGQELAAAAGGQGRQAALQ
jgi:cytochrome c oxidase subunit 2